jgi:deoxyribodipyrimidine photo-lyase
MYEKSVFIFRKDFRLSDNTGLIEALKLSNSVIPIFICTPEQLIRNKYKSDNAVQFMFESLAELDQELKKKGSKLFYFFGKPHEVVDKLLKNDDKIEAIYLNRDYTPYSIKRDNLIENCCKKYSVDFNGFEDCLLHPVATVLTGDKVYTKFTPYFNKAKNLSVKKPVANGRKNYISSKTRIVGQLKQSVKSFYNENDQIAVHGGRNNGLKILKNIKKFKDYNKMRNCLNWNTTRLSAYIKFGTVSIREVYHQMKKVLGLKNDLIKQLFWRDFYFNISWEHPTTITDGEPMKEKYSKLKWENNKEYIKAWKNGLTGYPVVDAGQRELNETGFMHNRARLISSNWLIKLARVDWNIGEEYFAQKLVDYSPSVNNGQWQWSSGSGADSQPYFRVFNPWIQGERYDKDAEYIKQWVPELADVDPKDIHEWATAYKKYPDIDYPAPVFDYAIAKEKGQKMYIKIYK